MAQFSITPPAIDAESKSGTQLAADLSSLNGAINSSHEGATAPTYAGSGLVWSSKTGDQVNVKDSVGSYILGHRPITSIADLRSFGAGLKEKDVVRIQVSGEVFDYYWDSTSEEADNGTTIILPAGWTDPGRWKRLTGSATGVNWWTTEEAAVIYDGSPEYFIVSGDKTETYVKDRALTLTQTTDALVYVASSALDCGGDTVVQVIGGDVDSGLSVVEYGQLPGSEPYQDFSALTEETTPASGDLLVLEKNGTGDKRKVDVDNIGGSSKVTGEVFWFAGSTIPDDCLECDGSAISREDYADLFTAIGTTWGVGNGSTTFNIPNAKTAGRFLRSRTASTALGTAQNDAYLNHSHSGSSNTTGSHSHTTTLAKGTTGTVSNTNTPPSSASSGVWGDYSWNTNSTGNHSHTITVSNSTTGGTETRPTNLSMILCIKY